MDDIFETRYEVNHSCNKSHCTITLYFNSNFVKNADATDSWRTNISTCNGTKNTGSYCEALKFKNIELKIIIECK